MILSINVSDEFEGLRLMVFEGGRVREFECIGVWKT